VVADNAVPIPSRKRGRHFEVVGVQRRWRPVISDPAVRRCRTRFVIGHQQRRYVLEDLALPALRRVELQLDGGQGCRRDEHPLDLGRLKGALDKAAA
jgi:hypothetical protein